MNVKFNEQAVEAVAREYCRLAGENPDVQVADQSANQHGGAYYVCQRWRNVAILVRERLLMDAAMSTPPPGTVSFEIPDVSSEECSK